MYFPTKGFVYVLLCGHYQACEREKDRRQMHVGYFGFCGDKTGTYCRNTASLSGFVNCGNESNHERLEREYFADGVCTFCIFAHIEQEPLNNEPWDLDIVLGETPPSTDRHNSCTEGLFASIKRCFPGIFRSMFRLSHSHPCTVPWTIHRHRIARCIETNRSVTFKQVKMSLRVSYIV